MPMRASELNSSFSVNTCSQAVFRNELAEAKLAATITNLEGAIEDKEDAITGLLM